MLKNYIKMALKVLLRRKGFTAISLFTISFTLMVLMVATALFDHIFGSFPPETRADRTLILRSLKWEGPEKGYRIQGPSYAFLQRYVSTSSLAHAEKVSMSESGISTATTFRNGEKIESKTIVQYAEFHLNHRIFLYGLVMSLGFGLISGVYPAWKM